MMGNSSRLRKNQQKTLDLKESNLKPISEIVQMCVEVTWSILGKASQPLWHFSLHFLFGSLTLTASVIVTAPAAWLPGRSAEL
jgi:hypothetical protein